MAKQTVTAVEAHEFVTHLYWKFRDTNLSAEDFAAFLLLAMYREGMLAPSLAPEGPEGAQQWAVKNYGAKK